MRIGVIGAGSVGGTLGRRWAERGHEVLFGVRDATDEKVRRLLSASGGRARAGSVEQAGAFGEVVVLTTPWSAAESALRAAGDLRGKTLLDCTNPLKSDLSGLTIGHTTSGGEQVAAWARGAKIVKIFNTTGFDNMADPEYKEGPATMLYCGDDSSAKTTAATLAADLGFDPVDAGPLVQARLLEPYALLWITLAYKQGLGRSFAFRLVRR
jgi:predicted dinucleotide-binding enzyme